MNIKQLKVRENDMEVRSCDDRLLSRSLKHTTAEIVIWDKTSEGRDYCFTAAYWHKDGEGYYLHFVGNRPFKCNKDTFWYLAELGQKHLDAEYEKSYAAD